MNEGKWTIGIESTAHTFSFGLVDPNGIPYPSVGDTIKPLEGGIHPREAADHHRDFAAELFMRAFGFSESSNFRHWSYCIFAIIRA